MHRFIAFVHAFVLLHGSRAQSRALVVLILTIPPLQSFHCFQSLSYRLTILLVSFYSYSVLAERLIARFVPADIEYMSFLFTIAGFLFRITGPLNVAHFHSQKHYHLLLF